MNVQDVVSGASEKSMTEPKTVIEGLKRGVENSIPSGAVGKQVLLKTENSTDLYFQ